MFSLFSLAYIWLYKEYTLPVRRRHIEKKRARCVHTNDWRHCNTIEKNKKFEVLLPTRTIFLPSQTLIWLFDATPPKYPRTFLKHRKINWVTKLFWGTSEIYLHTKMRSWIPEKFLTPKSKIIDNRKHFQIRKGNGPTKLFRGWAWPCPGRYTSILLTQ